MLDETRVILGEFAAVVEVFCGDEGGRREGCEEEGCEVHFGFLECQCKCKLYRMDSLELIEVEFYWEGSVLSMLDKTP